MSVFHTGSKVHAILRGVKEVNKALRKAPAKTPSSTTAQRFPGVVIIAGDISPPEVIMHLPVACEDVGAPYFFVPSRAELGFAAKTKRPTSVIMLLPNGKKAKGNKATGDAMTAEEAEAEAATEKEYQAEFTDVAKLGQKEYSKQLVGQI